MPSNETASPVRVEPATSPPASPGPRPARRPKGRRRLAPLLAVFVAVIIGASFVTADVVLSYGATGTVGANSTTPFWFSDGGDYNAVATGFVGVACSGSAPAAGTAGTCGGTAEPTASTAIAYTLKGVQSVNTYIVDISQFNIANGFPSAGGFWVSPVSGNVATAWAGVTCAYAFISTVAPTINPSTLSATAPAGGGAPCNVFEPTVTGGDLEDFNLVTAASANPAGCAGQAGVTYIGGACGAYFYTDQAKFGANTAILYVSLVIGVSTAAPAGSTTLLINAVAN